MHIGQGWGVKYVGEHIDDVIVTYCTLCADFFKECDFYYYFTRSTAVFSVSLYFKAFIDVVEVSR